MTFKKFLIFICVMMVLFTVAGVNAGDVNDTVIASEDQNEEILTENQDNNELSATEENELSANVGTFTDLADEIKKADELNLTRNYDYTALIGHKITDSQYVDGIPVNKKITINGNGFTIDGKNKASAFFILKTTNQIVLNNITFKNCYSPSIGGAIFSSATNIVISNCKFIDNSAKDYGAAIYMVGENGTVTNCTFTNNKASDGGAVVIYNKCTISNCIFTDNKADKGGAAMAGNKTIISNCSFTNNTSNNGGALWLQEDSPIVINCRFTNNVAKDAGGAVLVAENSKTVVISNSTFTNNKATDGGAIQITSPTTVSDCSFTDNTANLAGAIWTQYDNCTIVNCSFNNNAAKDGGAIYVVELCINQIISNSTFTNNKATDGGAIIIFSPTAVSDCSFTNNTANRAGAIWMQGVNSTLKNCSFTNNTGLTRAGAILLSATTNCNVKNCNFTNNVAKDDGGAIFWDNNNNGNVEHSHFINNSANEGSAMYGGTAVNCSFTNNNIYGTTIQFNVKDTVTYIENTVMFYGLPECNLTVTASDKNGATKTFDISDKGWNIGDLKAGNYTVKFTIKEHDENRGELTVQITVMTKQIQELDELIRNTQNDTIVLNHNYTCYDKGELANGIIINKSITIDGQGHKIDANNAMRIFQTTNNANVTFKNMIFTNGQAKYGGFGAAIWNNGAKTVTAINCTFESNQASYGGALTM